MLGVRLDPELERRLRALSRATNRSRSDLVREAVRRYLQERDIGPEARRQSLAVAGPADDDAIDFIEQVGSGDGWT